MSDKIHSELQQVFRSVFDNNAIVITEETTAKDIDGWDSLTDMTLINDIEQHFKIEFSFNEVSNFKKVGDIINTIRKKV